MEYLHDIYFTNLNAVHRNGGFFTSPPGCIWEEGEHRFEQNRFYFITEGSCTVSINNTVFNGKKGDWFFIPANALNSYSKSPGTKFCKYWIHFDIYPDSVIFSDLNLKYCVRAENNPDAEKLFEEYAEIYCSNSFTDQIRIKAIILNLIAIYIELSKTGNSIITSKSEERLMALLAYINENLDKTLTSEFLAKEICHMHPTHFVRYFKEKTSVTPQKYILQRRMETANRLLLKTDMPMSEIACAAGLYDAAHFTRQFKRFFGTTPLLYRKTYSKST